MPWCRSGMGPFTIDFSICLTSVVGKLLLSWPACNTTLLSFLPIMTRFRVKACLRLH